MIITEDTKSEALNTLIAWSKREKRDNRLTGESVERVFETPAKEELLERLKDGKERPSKYATVNLLLLCNAVEELETITEDGKYAVLRLSSRDKSIALALGGGYRSVHRTINLAARVGVLEIVDERYVYNEECGCTKPHSRTFVYNHKVRPVLEDIVRDIKTCHTLIKNDENRSNTLNDNELKTCHTLIPNEGAHDSVSTTPEKTCHTLINFEQKLHNALKCNELKTCHTLIPNSESATDGKTCHTLIREFGENAGNPHGSKAGKNMSLIWDNNNIKYFLISGERFKELQDELQGLLDARPDGKSFKGWTASKEWRVKSGHFGRRKATDKEVLDGLHKSYPWIEYFDRIYSTLNKYLPPAHQYNHNFNISRGTVRKVVYESKTKRGKERVKLQRGGCISKIGYRPNSAFCTTSTSGGVREAILRSEGFKNIYTYDVKSSIYRVTASLRFGKWIDESVDFYPLLLPGLQRADAKNMAMRVYFGCSPADAFAHLAPQDYICPITGTRTTKLETNGKEKEEAMKKLLEEWYGNLDKYTGGSYGSEVFLHESCIYTLLHLLLILLGVRVAQVYDCFYSDREDIADICKKLLPVAFKIYLELTAGETVLPDAPQRLAALYGIEESGESNPSRESSPEIENPLESPAKEPVENPAPNSLDSCKSPEDFLSLLGMEDSKSLPAKREDNGKGEQKDNPKEYDRTTMQVLVKPMDKVEKKKEKKEEDLPGREGVSDMELIMAVADSMPKKSPRDPLIQKPVEDTPQIAQNSPQNALEKPSCGQCTPEPQKPREEPKESQESTVKTKEDEYLDMIFGDYFDQTA